MEICSNTLIKIVERENSCYRNIKEKIYENIWSLILGFIQKKSNNIYISILYLMIYTLLYRKYDLRIYKNNNRTIYNYIYHI